MTRLFSKFTKQVAPPPTDKSEYPWAKYPFKSSIFPRSLHAACPVSSSSLELFVFGGIAKGDLRKDLYILDVESLSSVSFSSSGDVPAARINHTMVNIGGYILVYGGDTKKTADEDLYILNISLRQWTKALIQGPKPAARQGHTATVIGPFMYVFGGMSNNRASNEIVVFDIRSLQSPSPSWQFIRPATEELPPPRYDHCACEADGKIYIFGGTDGEQVFNDVWCYDAQKNFWQKLSTSGFVPTPCFGSSAAHVKGVIYIFGGRGKDGSELGELWALKISNRRWFKFKNMGSPPNMRKGHTLSVLGDRIVVLGGEPVKPDEQNIIHVLDTAKIKYPSDSTPPNGNGKHASLHSSGALPPGHPLSPGAAEVNRATLAISLLGNGERGSSNTPIWAQAETDRPLTRQSALPTAGGRLHPINRVSAMPTSTEMDKKPPMRHQSMMPEAMRRKTGSGFDPNRPSSPLVHTPGNNNSNPSVSGGPRVQSLGKGNEDGLRYTRTMSPTMSQDSRGLHAAPFANHMQSKHQNGPPPRPSRDGIDISSIISATTHETTIEENSHLHQQTQQQQQQHQHQQPLQKTRRSPSDIATTSGIPVNENGSEKVVRNTQQPHAMEASSNSGVGRSSIASSLRSLTPDGRSAPGINGNSEVRAETPIQIQGQNGIKTSKPALRPSQIYSQKQEQDPQLQKKPQSSEAHSTRIETPHRQSNGRAPENFEAERQELLKEIRIRDQKLAEYKHNERWWRAEVSLARKSRASEMFTTEEKAELKQLLDLGEKGSDKYRVVDALVQLQMELKRMKNSIATQAQIASNKIGEAEQMRTVALQEAAYYKSRLEAMRARAPVSEEIETARTLELEKRLATSLRECELLRSQLETTTRHLKHEQFARGSAEERANEAGTRAEEARRAHEAALKELEVLHERTHAAEALARENASRLADTDAELVLHRSGTDSLSVELEQLRQKVEQSEAALTKASAAANAAGARAEEAESMWATAKEEAKQLEMALDAKQTELIARDRKLEQIHQDLERARRDAERSGQRAAELERLWRKAKEEAEAMRALAEQRSASPSTRSLQNDRTIELEKQLACLRSLQKETQSAADRASAELANAKSHIASLERHGMQTRSEIVSLKARLAEAVDGIAKAKTALEEKEAAFMVVSRSLEEAEVRVGMMRDAMVQKGFTVDIAANGDPTNDRAASFIQKMHQAEERAQKAENELATATNSFQDRARQLETNYEVAMQRVREAESMLHRVKMELERNLENNSALAAELDKLREKNRELEEQLSTVSDAHERSREEVAALQRQIEDLHTRPQSASSSNSSSEEEISRLVEEKTKMEVERNVINTRHLELKRETAELQEEVKRLQCALEESRADLQESLQLNEQLNAQLEAAAKDIDGIGGGNNEALKQELEALREEKQILETRCLEAEKKIGLLFDQLDQHTTGKAVEPSVTRDHHSAEPQNVCREEPSAEVVERYSLQNTNSQAIGYAEVEDHPPLSPTIDALADEIEMLRAQWDDIGGPLGDQQITANSSHLEDYDMLMTELQSAHVQVQMAQQQLEKQKEAEEKLKEEVVEGYQGGIADKTARPTSTSSIGVPMLSGMNANVMGGIVRAASPVQPAPISIS
ncbi:uncharacterized protein VTP21DRAFT_7375 [Calcarisporiella thermophila]|uniref:uncharacterized protein n=1 Tax=Calcarisporiella thermophila TaxID=911321 RepID=UPI0037449B10